MKPVVSSWHQYALDIRSGKILACKKTRQSVDRYFADLSSPDIFLDEQEIGTVIEFVQSLTLADDKWSGKKIVLLPWQHFLIANLIGWKRTSDNLRRFRRAYISMAKKNGKSTIIAILALFALLITERGEIWSIANTKEQASISFNYAKNIVIHSAAALGGLIDVFAKALVCRKRISSFKPLSKDVKSFDGKNTSMLIADEIAAYKDSRTLDTVASGMGARAEPLTFMITTANYIQDSPGRLEYLYSEKLLNGTIQDDEYFALIYELDTDDDWKDATTYAKANPSHGHLISLADLEHECKTALEAEYSITEFRTKKCNQWLIGTQGGWIGDDKWKPAISNAEKYAAYITEDLLPTYPCGMGFDLSKRDDFSVYTIAWYIAEIDRYYLRHHYYIPKPQIAEKLRRDSHLVLNWIEQRYIFATDMPTQDYVRITTDLFADIAKYKPIRVSYDPYMASEIKGKIESDTIFVPVGQRAESISEPTKDFQELVLNEKIIDNNPVCRWNVSNCVVETWNNNIKVVKATRNSPLRVDGVISSIMAIMPLKALQYARPAVDTTAALDAFIRINSPAQKTGAKPAISIAGISRPPWRR